MTDTLADTKRLEKIRKLLAKAESTNHPEEAKSFTAKATALMTEWAIDEAMLRGYKEAQVQEIMTVRVDLTWGPYLSPNQDLLHRLAQTQDCKSVFYSGNDYTQAKKVGKKAWAEVIGFPRDLEFVQMLFTSLLLQAQTEFLTADVQAKMFAETSHPGHRIRWRNAFMQGYTSAVIFKIREMKRSTIADAEPGVGLVLADKGKLVKEAFDNKYTHLKMTSSSAGNGAGSGRGMGAAAGRKANVGGTSVGGNKGAIK